MIIHDLWAILEEECRIEKALLFQDGNYTYYLEQMPVQRFVPGRGHAIV